MKKIMILLVTLFASYQSQAQNCQAAFYMDFGAPGDLGVQFTDQSWADSLDQIIDWQWNFGDGFSISEPYGTYYQYPGEGYYEPCLTITTAAGCVSTTCDSLFVGGGFPCVLSAYFITTVSGQTASFTTFPFGGAPPVSYVWDFGDGTISTVEAPSHTYTNVGEYEVCLTITDADGCTATSCEIVTIFDPAACEAGFSVFQNDSIWGPPIPGLDRFVFFQDESVNATAWAWDFGDGGTSTEQYPTYEYAEAGIYTVCLTITNDAGCTDTNCQDIEVLEAIGFCEAYFYYQSADSPLTFNFEDASWIAADSWLWDFGDGSTSTDQHPTYTFGDYGTYEVCLTITADSCITSTCNTLVLTDPGACNASFYAFSDSFGIVLPPFPVYLYYFIDNSTNASSWEWDMGDGTILNGPQIDYIYAEAGTYTVCLTITNDFGCTDTYCEDIEVAEGGAGGCFASYWTSTLDDGSIQFQDISWGDVVEWYWDFGDGGASNEQNPNYAYAAPGYYEACLTIVTTDSCSNTICQGVNIADPVACDAYFIGLPNGGLSWLFCDFSTGLITSWEWTFGDGGTSNESYPEYTYSAPGTYTVCLTVSNDLGCIDTYCEDIVVTDTGGGGGPDSTFCQASFFSSANGTTANFYDGSFPFADTWSWTFGDGGTSTDQNPEYTYAGFGDFEVCLTITATIDSCTSTYCEIVTIADPADCEAYFEVFPSFFDSIGIGVSNTVFFFDLSTGAATSWFWDFGDGNTSTESQAIHTYDDLGIYSVCLTISNDFGCTDTYCVDIEVTEVIGSGCTPSFWYSNVGLTASFVDVCIPGVVSWEWTFGDGGTSTETNPIYTYNEAGEYEVCLTVTMEDGCTGTSCQIIYVDTTTGGPDSSLLRICGFVSTGDFAIDWDLNATVYLIQHDDVAGTLTAVDSVVIAATDSLGFFAFFCFENLVFDAQYLIKVAMNEDSPLYADYIPTYFDYAMTWDAAVPITALGDIWLDVMMIPGVNPGGPGFVGGLITDGAGKQEGETGVPGIEVILMDMDGNPFAYTYTDEEGNYTFDGIPYGTYQVHVEILGHNSTPFIVTISPDAPTHDVADFVILGNDIVPLEATGINSIGNDVVSVNVYPNPTAETAYVNIQVTETQAATLSVYNAAGQQLLSEKATLNAGDSQLKVDVSRYVNGMYIIQLEGESGLLYSGKLIKE